MKTYVKPKLDVVTFMQGEELANQWVDNNGDGDSVGVSAPNLWWPEEQLKF